jgi:PPM family protein phosphatase
MKKNPPREKQTPVSLKWSGWTDRGKVRVNNEDSFLGLQFDANEIFRLGQFGDASLENMDFTFAISDGMGGAKAGEYASRIAVEKITTLLPRAFQHPALGLQPEFSDVLAELFDRIHRNLVFVGYSYEETAGMQATLSLCWFTPGGMYFGHIGDSRIYCLPKRKKKIKQITHDDTHVGWLLRTGQINEREAHAHPRRNALQKALGGGNQFVGPQVGAIPFERGDIFLLCTDGLVDGLYDGQLAELLRKSQNAKKNSNPAQLLVETSVKNSGRDNTTALVIQII